MNKIRLCACDHCVATAILAGRVSVAMGHLRNLDAVLSEHQHRDLRENSNHRHVAVVAREGIA